MISSVKTNQTFHSMIEEDLKSDSDESFHSCDYEQEEQQVAQQESKIQSPFDTTYFKFQDKQQIIEDHPRQEIELAIQNKNDLTENLISKQKSRILEDIQSDQSSMQLDYYLDETFTDLNKALQQKLQPAYNRLYLKQQKQLNQKVQQKKKKDPLNLTRILLTLMFRYKGSQQFYQINNSFDILSRVISHILILYIGFESPNFPLFITFAICLTRMIYLCCMIRLLVIKHDEKKRRFFTSLCNFMRKTIGVAKKVTFKQMDEENEENHSNCSCKIVFFLIIPVELSIIVLPSTGRRTSNLMRQQLQMYTVCCWMYKGIELVIFYPLIIFGFYFHSTSQMKLKLIQFLYMVILIDVIKNIMIIFILIRADQNLLKKENEKQLLND